MSDVVIKAEGLGKKYIIGHETQQGRGRYTALRDVMVHNAHALWSKTRDLLKGKPIIPGDTLEEIWALKELDFEIDRGEAIGIVGRNGAGKSTLLKVLSRITEPSTGRVTIRGRVASLLEVGTGFHLELTGRENIYLNGAILGMTRAEVRRKFDEIVDFAGVEKFLDTPVKRYSSGMYVRLAFAVAAHLEPEILVVDEVLAVGDVEFQKKCLGKMGDVASGGRTVLFVSHNMMAIRSLCQRALLLRSGMLELVGDVETVSEAYLNTVQVALSVPIHDRIDRKGTGRFRFQRLSIVDAKDNIANRVWAGDDIAIVLEYLADPVLDLERVTVEIAISSVFGQRLCTLQSDFTGDYFTGKVTHGQFKCRVPRFPLASGSYKIDLRAMVGGEIIDWLTDAAPLNVTGGDYFGTGKMPDAPTNGSFLVPHSWEHTHSVSP